jgi:hypothetical protein
LDLLGVEVESESGDFTVNLYLKDSSESIDPFLNLLFRQILGALDGALCGELSD